MKIVLKNLIFIIILIIVTSFSLQIQDIPISLNPDFSINSTDFIHKYRVFILVGNRLKNRVTSTLSTFLHKNYQQNAFCLVPSIKQYSSLKRKIDFELKLKKYSSFFYKDFEDVKDFVRSSLIFSSKSDIFAASKKLESIFGKYTKKDDSFDEEKSPLGKGKTGYRDLSYNFVIKELPFAIRINKTISERGHPDPYYMKFELQLHICGIFLAKQIGHPIYELTRILSQITDLIHFGMIIPEQNQDDFYEIFDKIKEILPGNQESDALIKSFEVWKEEKNEQKLIKDLLDRLKSLSIEIYTKALETNQGDCIKSLKELLLNESCKFKTGANLDEISRAFVQKLLYIRKISI